MLLAYLLREDNEIYNKFLVIPSLNPNPPPKKKKTEKIEYIL